MTMSEFVVSMKDEYPNLMDFMGISEATMDVEWEGQEAVFEEHLSVEDMSMKVKQGELF